MVIPLNSGIVLKAMYHNDSVPVSWKIISICGSVGVGVCVYVHTHMCVCVIPFETFNLHPPLTVSNLTKIISQLTSADKRVFGKENNWKITKKWLKN